MKKLFFLFFITINVLTVNAQDFDGNTLQSLPNRVNRIACIEHDGNLPGNNTGRQMHRSSSQANAPLKSIGSPEIVVCLAEYSDTKYTCANGTFDTHEAMLAAVKDSFEIFFNGEGQTVSKNNHSVKEYFEEMSFGKFTPHFNLITGVTVDNTQSYYSNANGSSLRATFRNDALTKLSPIIQDEVSNYDYNQDGMVDGVIIVFPGYGQNIVGDNKNMHPCCWSGSLTIGGVTYATELIAPELFNSSSNSINSYGVYVHEMSHMLGLPDFYDTKSTMTASGMDYWSLMDYGEYWKSGYHPTPYTAYERNFMGWLNLVELNEPTTVEGMKSVGEGGEAYVIYNDANHNEYYILENLSEGYSWSNSQCRSLGSGLIIYHVDYDANAWSGCYVNNTDNHQRMTIMPANGHFELCDNFTSDEKNTKWISELRGHLFPLKYEIASIVTYYGLTTGNNQLTDTERTEEVVSPAIDRIAPAATLYNANTDGAYLMHKPITEITYVNDSENGIHTCSFKFMGGGEPSGIKEFNKEQLTMNNCDVFNVAGQKVDGGFKGIVIKGGKKYIK